MDLDLVFSGLVSQIVGLDQNLVRPRWQSTEPKSPEAGVNWCAVGVLSAEPDDGPWIAYDGPSNTTMYWRHETLNVVATFYGPNCKGYCAALRDGLSIPQNTEALLPYAIRFAYSGTLTHAPEFYNQVWINRYDMPITFRRKIMRTYQTLNFVIAEVHLIDDTVVDDTIIVPPGSTLEP